MTIDGGGSVKDMLDGLVTIVHELQSLGVIIEDFKKNSQSVLFEKLNLYVKNLSELNRLRTAVEGSKVPQDVLPFLDALDANNPEIFTKQMLEQCANASESMSQRKEALKILKSQLLQGLVQLEEDTPSGDTDSSMSIEKNS